MKLSEHKKIEAETKNSEYGRKMEKLADEISNAMEEVGQGYIFSVIPSKGDKRAHFGAFKVDSKDFSAFWASILVSIQDVQRGIPEDEMQKFSEGFLPMIYLAIKYCFPSIRIAEDFYDEMEGGLNGNQD